MASAVWCPPGVAAVRARYAPSSVRTGFVLGIAGAAVAWLLWDTLIWRAQYGPLDVPPFVNVQFLVGGGIAGVSPAWHLVRAGWRDGVLFERAATPKPKTDATTPAATCASNDPAQR